MEPVNLRRCVSAKIVVVKHVVLRCREVRPGAQATVCSMVAGLTGRCTGPPRRPWTPTSGANMAKHGRHWLKLASITCALLATASAFASEPGPSQIRDGEMIAVSALVGAPVGFLGAAFNMRAPRLFFISLVASPFLLAVLMAAIFPMLAMLGGGIVLAGAVFAVPFMIGEFLVYGLIRLALRVFARPRR